MKYAARFFISFLLLVTCLLALSLPNGLLVPSVSAQTNPSLQNSSGQANLTPNTNSDVEPNLHNWTQTVLIEVLAAASCHISGIDPINPKGQCLGVDQTTGKIGFIPSSQAPQGKASGQMGGILGVTAYALDKLFTPPLHTNDYLAYLGENFGLTKKAYAQGAGLTGLSPLLPLWTVFRNVVYLAFVVVFVVIGLAIMLRIKLDPRTVMSVENQLPKIIIGILLVTFSIAIAGFVIDLMYLSMYLVYNVIASANLSTNLATLNPALLQGKTPLDAIGGAGTIDPSGAGTEGLHNIAGAIAVAVKAVFKSSLGITNYDFTNAVPLIGIDTNNVVEKITSGNFGGIFSFNFLPIGPTNLTDWIINMLSGFGAAGLARGLAQLVPGAGDILPTKILSFGVLWTLLYTAIELAIREIIPLLIVYLVVIIAMVWAMFRLGFELIKAYVFVLLTVVLAPFWIVAGLFPGSPLGFGAWLRNLAANLSPFPVTIGMLLLGKVFVDVFKGTTTNPLFVPPLLGNPTGGQASPIAALIGLGFILLTPQVVTMMKDFLKVPQLKYGASIGQAITVGTGAINLPEHAKELGMMGYYAGHIKELPFGIGSFLGGKGKTNH